MSVGLALALVFASLSLVAWTALRSGAALVAARSESVALATETRLRDLFVFADTRRLLALYLAALVGLPLALHLLGQPLPVVLAVAFALILSPRWLLARLVERRRRRITLALPDALAQVAGAMRAGSTFTTALQSMVEEQKGPLGQEFGLLLREQRLGARLEEALDNLGERVQSEEMDLAIAAVLIAQEVGGNLAEILARLSATIRRKLEMEGKVRALTAQGVLQGRVVTALPFLVLGALYLIEPEATAPMFTGLLGWSCLALVVLLQLVGSRFIARIVRIEI